MIKLIDIINELGINNPNIKWEDIQSSDNNWNIPKNPDTFLKDLKSLCLSDSHRYPYLNSIYKKGFYNVIYKTTKNINDFKSINWGDDEYIGVVTFRKIIKIINILKLDTSNVTYLRGRVWYKDWEHNMSGYNGNYYFSPSSWLTVLIIENVMFYEKSGKWYVLTPSKNTISLSNIDFKNNKHKKEISKPFSWRNLKEKAEVRLDTIDIENKKLEISFYWENKKIGDGIFIFNDVIIDGTNWKYFIREAKGNIIINNEYKKRYNRIYIGIDFNDTIPYMVDDIKDYFVSKSLKDNPIEIPNEDELVKKWINE